MGLHNSSSSVQKPQLADEFSSKKWHAEHPSALRSFDLMMSEAKGKKLVVFLDYDGTLSHIVEDPDLAFMSDEMRVAVREVAKCFPTAIISGRIRDKVKQFVQLSNVYYAGSHGMDIVAPLRQAKHHSVDKKEFLKENEILFQPARTFLPAIQDILKILKRRVKNIQGSRIEDNRFCISVHFRQVQQADFAALEGTVMDVLGHYPEFELRWGKKVMEIRPKIEWDKGYAVEYFLEALGLGTSADVLPLYIGDDQTDEDAFKVIKKRGKGYPIIVSSSPKETEALFSLNDPTEVLNFLLHLARWRKLSSSKRSLIQIYDVNNYMVN